MTGSQEGERGRPFCSNLPFLPTCCLTSPRTINTTTINTSSFFHNSAPTLPMEKEQEWIIWKQWKIWVPPPLVHKILEKLHNSPLARHPGIKKTLESIEWQYLWPSMKDDIIMYVQGCEKCQQSKLEWTKWWAPLIPHDIPPHPWHTISWDIIGPITKSSTYDCILVICDKLMKMTLLELVNTTLTTQGAAQILWDWVLWSYGIPCKIISDWGPQFVLNSM